MRRTMAAVIGSGSDPHTALSEPLGRWLAEKGFDLVNGGGAGVMGAVAKAFSEVKSRKGRVVGILPSSAPCNSPSNRARYQPSPGYPNPHTDIAIRTHLHLSGESGKEIPSRNHIVVLTGDVVVALPGSDGTRSEIELALEYKKPIVLISPHGEWEEFASRAPVVKTINDAMEWLEKQVQ